MQLPYSQSYLHQATDDEQAFIGAVIRSRSVDKQKKLLSTVDDKSLVGNYAKQAYRICQELLRDGVPVDIVAASKACGHDMKLMAWIAEAPDAVLASGFGPDHAEKIKERYIRAEIAKMAHEAEVGNRPLFDVLGKLDALCDAELPRMLACEYVGPSPTQIYCCQDFLNHSFGKIEPLIGSPRDALLVPGEGLMIAGAGGAGKTAFLVDFAFRAASGLDVLKWVVGRPLKVLIVQAELPPQFFQQRLKAMLDDYSFASPAKAQQALGNIYVAHVIESIDLAEGGNACQVIGEEVVKCDADLVIIDPFLSFFSADENDNGGVRRALDQIKRVAEKHGFGLVISDHQPKYAGTSQHQQNSMRGAGAKRDWAASVLVLSPAKTPEGEHGKFVKLTVDKLRYGPVPNTDFFMRRSDTFRHDLWRGSSIEPLKVAELISDNSGNIPKAPLRNLLMTTFNISKRVSEKLMDDATEGGWVVVEDGPRGAKLHNVGPRYLAKSAA